MTWLHRRWSRRVALLAVDALEPSERALVLAHVERCPACAEALATLRAVWRTLDDDPALSAEPPISAEALHVRVMSRLDRLEASRRPRVRPLLVPLGVAAALVVVVGVGLLLRGRPDREPMPEARIQVPTQMLDTMDRHLARERAARYLADARDVLVHVASESPRCDRRRRQVDVQDERRRSRELLVKRALLVDVQAPTVAPARGVLEDVERSLRAVAALDPCCDPAALIALRDDLARSRLLMKIDLVSRELVG
jgi:hypothetical protein